MIIYDASLIILLFFCTFMYNIRIIDNYKSDMNKNYLSIDTCNSLRGLFALTVVFHHLSQIIQGGYLFSKFSQIGYLAVSMFFFLSGCGLQKSFINKENYLEKYLANRLPKIIIPYVVANLVYICFYNIFGIHMSLRNLFIGLFCFLLCI